MHFLKGGCGHLLYLVFIPSNTHTVFIINTLITIGQRRGHCIGYYETVGIIVWDIHTNKDGSFWFGGHCIHSDKLVCGSCGK